ncbi:MAG: hypothetical protein ACKOCM_00570, partial [Cyanobacteriota bacterium]
RMAGRDPFLDRDVGEQKAAALLLTSHHGICDCSILAGIAGFFSELLGTLTEAPGGIHGSRLHQISGNGSDASDFVHEISGF